MRSTTLVQWLLLFACSVTAAADSVRGRNNELFCVASKPSRFPMLNRNNGNDDEGMYFETEAVGFMKAMRYRRQGEREGRCGEVCSDLCGASGNDMQMMTESKDSDSCKCEKRKHGEGGNSSKDGGKNGCRKDSDKPSYGSDSSDDSNSGDGGSGSSSSGSSDDGDDSNSSDGGSGSGSSGSSDDGDDSSSSDDRRFRWNWGWRHLSESIDISVAGCSGGNCKNNGGYGSGKNNGGGYGSGKNNGGGGYGSSKNNGDGYGHGGGHSSSDSDDRECNEEIPTPSPTEPVVVPATTPQPTTREIVSATTPSPTTVPVAETDSPTTKSPTTLPVIETDSPTTSSPTTAAPISGAGGRFETCGEQSQCLTFTYNVKTTDLVCGGTLEYEICAKLDFTKPGCGKTGTISHSCVKEGVDTCSDSPESGFSLASDIIGIGMDSPFATQCQTVAPGETVEFLFKDGTGCDADPANYVPSNDDELAASCSVLEESPLYQDDGSYGSCTGNQRKECVWTLIAPTA